MARRRRTWEEIEDDDFPDWQPPSGRRRRLLLVAVPLLAAGAWFAPAAAVLTPLRDQPLNAIFAGIDGSIGSRTAAWNWVGSVEYRDVIVRDRQGRGVVAIDRISLDRGMLGLAANRSDLGTLRIAGVEALLEVRRGGSNLEDLLAPWLAATATAAVPRLSIEIVDAAVRIIDTERRDEWRIGDVVASGPVGPEPSLDGWAVSGRLMHASAAAAIVDRPPDAAANGPFDRRPIAAAATAALAKDGGWSVSATVDPVADTSLALATTHLPLGITSVLATRFDGATVLDGLADLRMDLHVPRRPPGQGSAEPARPWTMAGTVSGNRLAVCDAATLRERLAIDRLDAPFDLSIEGRTVNVRKLEARSPLFKAEASGRILLPGGSSWDWLEHLARSDFAFSADIDLAAAAKALPGGLEVRPDVRVTAGQMQLAAAAYADGGERVLEMRASSRDLAAVQGNRQLRWNEPFTAWLRGRRAAAAGERLRIEEARIASAAVELTATGSAEGGNLEWTVDLDRIVEEASELLDLQTVEIAGTSRGRLDVVRRRTGQSYAATISSSVENLTLHLPGRPRLREPKLSLEATGAGSFAGAAVLLDDAHGRIASAEDSLEATLTGGALVDYAAILSGGSDRGLLIRAAPSSAGIAADLSVEGDVEQWHRRLAVFADVVDPERTPCGGTLRASATLAAQGDVWQVTKAAVEIEKPSVRLEGRSIEEPRLVASGAGAFHPASGRVDLSSAEVLTSTVSLRTGGLSILPATAADGTANASIAIDRIRGKAQWQADLARLERWVAPPLFAAAWPVAGRAWGSIEVLDTPAGTNVWVEATGDALSLASVPASSALGIGGGAPPKEIWREPRAKLVAEVTHAPHLDRVVVNRLSLDSTTAAFQSAGAVDAVSSRAVVDLSGSFAYDWNSLSRLLTPWTGGNVLLAGSGSRAFAIRGPLRDPSRLAVEPPPGEPARSIVLPDDWLKAARGVDAATDPAASGRIAIPASMPQRPPDDPTRWMRAVSFDTSLAWQAAQVGGVPIDGGEMPLRLLDGQLAFGPFDVGAAGGRLRGGPWLRLVPGPMELVVPPGRIVDKVDLSNQFCDRWLRWVAPLIAQSTEASGRVSIDTAGARVPLADPLGGEFSGQVHFDQLEVTPGPPAQALVALIGRLQGLLDPRFAIGDKVVLMRVRPDPVRVMLSQRRIWHDGFVMDAGQLVVKTNGSVGADGTLAMTAEVAFRGDLVGQTPVVAALMRTPVVIPLRGTVNRPQFDAAAIDQIVARIVENTAQAVIGDGLNRGLEALFGNPQPPPPAK